MSLEIHPASSADYSEFARLFRELAVPEAPPSPDSFERAIVPDALIARTGHDVVGYAWARVRGDRMHVVHVVADPAHRRRGVGSALMEAIAEQARRARVSKWQLNVKPDNRAARRLYEQYGMQVSLESVAMRIRWTEVANLVGSPGVTPVTVAPTDDARFEPALGLAPGEIAAMRVLPGRVMLGATDADGPTGFMAFDPAYPGASALRVRAPTDLPVLLDGARRVALPEHDYLQLFVEGDPALERALAAAGATVVMRVLQMDGPIASS